MPRIIKKFVDAFICYKQNCEVASFNLGHPVGQKSKVQNHGGIEIGCNSTLRVELRVPVLFLFATVAAAARGLWIRNRRSLSHQARRLMTMTTRQQQLQQRIMPLMSADQSHKHHSLLTALLVISSNSREYHQHNLHLINYSCRL